MDASFGLPFARASVAVVAAAGGAGGAHGHCGPLLSWDCSGWACRCLVSFVFPLCSYSSGLGKEERGEKGTQGWDTTSRLLTVCYFGKDLNSSFSYRVCVICALHVSSWPSVDNLTRWSFQVSHGGRHYAPPFAFPLHRFTADVILRSNKRQANRVQWGVLSLMYTVKWLHWINPSLHHTF